MLNTKFTEHLAILGFVLFLGCAAVALSPASYSGGVSSPKQYNLLSLADAKEQFLSVDFSGKQFASFSAKDVNTTYGWIIVSTHSPTLCLIAWKASMNKKNMLVDEDRDIKVTAENKCPFRVQVTLNIQAPDFKVNQDNPTFSINPNENRTWSWVLQVQKICLLCAIDINANAENIPDPGSKIPKEWLALTPDTPASFTISVSGTFSIYILLVQFFSIIGTFLGPMLTIPWWYEQWQKHKDKKKATKSFKRFPHIRKTRAYYKKQKKAFHSCLD